MEKNLSQRDQIIDVVNKLFIYTDQQKWDKLINEVFALEIYVDMTSMGKSKPETIQAGVLCKNWEKGFEGLDAIHHQAGNYLIESMDQTEATVFANAIASHFKTNAKAGNTRTFVGSYKLVLKKTRDGWRISGFIYHLKYMTGNIDLS
jgi:hypothetical protein